LRKNRDKRKVLVVVAKKDEIKKSDGILTLTEKEEKNISLSLSLIRISQVRSNSES